MKYPTDSSEIKETADWLYDQDANVLALTGKSAELQSWSHWEDERQSAKEKDGLPWHKADGVGVISGINRWRCFDVDDCESLGIVLKILRGMGLPDNYRWVVKSGSREGFHIWFLCPDNDAFGGCENWIPADGQAFDHIEVRWKNHQTAMPPSIHPDTGKEYIFPKMPPKSEPQEVSADAVREGLRSVAKPKKSQVKGTRTTTAEGDFDDPEVETIRSALAALPNHFGEDRNSEWLPMIMAVKDGAPDDDTAEALLKDWRSEWETGEYDRVLESLDDGPPDGVDPVTVGTLFGTAQDHGWTFPNSDKPMDTFSVEDFEDALDGLQDRDAEREAVKMLDEVATLERSEIARCRDILEEHGARARRLRSWHSDAKAIKKEQDQQQSEGKREPEDLKHGELTAWITKEVLDDNAFALDGSGALYYYAGGCYHDGGEDYLNQQVKDILDAEDMTREFTRYRCEEVQHRIETDAPELWDDPPKNRINLKNGILNLDTGEVEEHGPRKWLSTRQIPIKHDPEAEGTAWRDALEQWFPDDAGAEVAFEWIAKQITPGYGRRKATYLYGGKSKGKSTLLRNLVEGVFGGQGVRHMTLQELSDDDYARAKLFDSSLNVCSDLPARPLEGTSVFKRVTGGDTISANRKYKDRFSFTPHCEMIFSGNVPICAPKGEAPFWDRWLVIPFRGESFEPGDEGHVPEEELDALLQDPEELSALLNEVLKVLPKVREEGVTETQSMADALESIRRHPKNDLSTPAAPRGASQTSGDSTPDVAESDVEMHPTGSDPDSPEHNEQALEHSEDEATAKHSPNNSSESGDSPPQHRGEGYTQDFEKKEVSDTGGTCPRNDAFQSFERGDPVETPTHGSGQIKRVKTGDPPKTLVAFSHGADRRFDPENLEIKNEAPF